MGKRERGTARHSVRRRHVRSPLERRRTLIGPEARGARESATAEPAATLDQRCAAARNGRRLIALLPFCSTCQFAMTIPANPATIPVITDGITHVLEEKHWPEEDVAAVQLALQEAMANAIRHGCRNDVSKYLQCSVTVGEPDDEVLIVVRDPGAGFDPESVANPLAPANALKPSGRGIFLIKNLMDHVQFADSGREVQMRKKKTSSLSAEAEGIHCCR